MIGRASFVLAALVATGCFADAPGIVTLDGDSTETGDPLMPVASSTGADPAGGSGEDSGLPDTEPDSDGGIGGGTTGLGESTGSDEPDDPSTSSDSTSSESTSSEGDSSSSTDDAGESSSSTGAALFEEHRVFITSTTHGAAMGGLEGADSICSDAAEAADLEGTWRALLSDSTESVETHVTIVGPVYTLGGGLVAMDSAALFSGTAEHPVDVSETGGAPLDTVAWVGSATVHCNDWSSGSSGVSGTQALSTNLDDWLLGSSLGPCSLSRSLYCIDQPPE